MHRALDVATMPPTVGPKLKLYIMPGACSLASHIALAWAGATYELEILTHEAVRAAPYRRINPKGVVPALAIADGIILTESLAILKYIAERYAMAGLGAGPDLLSRARLDECLAELVSDIHTTWSPIMVPERFVTIERNQEDAKQAAYLQLHEHYTRLDGEMRDKTWALFGRRTVADAYLYVMCSWQHRTPRPLSTYPALAKYKARLDEDAGVRRALAEEQAT